MEEHAKELAEQSLTSRTAFENISRLLSSFDSGKYKIVDGDAIPTLCHQWDLLRQVRQIVSSTFLVSRSIASRRDMIDCWTGFIEMPVFLRLFVMVSELPLTTARINQGTVPTR